MARRISDDVNSFDGSKLEPLVQLFKKIGRGSAMPAGSAACAEIPTLFVQFQAEVVRLELLLSLKSPKEGTPSQESYLSHVASVPNIAESDAKVPDAVALAEVLIEGAEPAAEVLPFGLQRCDVPQTLKRAEFRPVTIRNEVHWNLMQALMAAYPNALSEKTKKELFKFPNEQGNAKRLRSVLYDLGLTFHEWTLMEWDGDR